MADSDTTEPGPLDYDLEGRPYGALPPEDSGWQVGDRADKPCVIAASQALAVEGVHLSFKTVQRVIDAYLAEAEKRGWKLQ